jgi:hypothetical protein
MKKPVIMQAHQLEPFARFLEDHPGFSPYLVGADALVGGFQVGGSYLLIDDMERLIATRPRYNERQAALLLSVPAWSRKGRR